MLSPSCHSSTAMVVWAVVARVAESLPTFLQRRVPSRYNVMPGLREIFRRAQMMHLGGLVCLTVLVVAMVYHEDTRTLTHLKKGVANSYLALVPPHPDGLDTGQLWDVISQLVTSAVLNQNITHNGTFKGAVSLRQFRLTQNETQSFFPDCDFSRLDKTPMQAPNSTKVPQAYRYRAVEQVTWVQGHRCPYPPEGYSVYLGDLKGYAGGGNATVMFSGVNVTINLGVNPLEVLNESLSILDDLKRHSWVDSLTMALLVTFLAAQPSSATPTAITVIFENPVQRGDEDSNPVPRWWSSHFVVAVDLRSNDVVTVLLTVFPFVHVVVMWFEANVPFALMLTDRGEAARRCITLVTAVHVTVLALHIAAVCLHYSSLYEALEEVSKYYVSFDMRFNPENYEDGNTSQILPVSAEEGKRVGQESEAKEGRDKKVLGLKWDPEYRISVRRITLARILYLKATSWMLLSIEVMLYLASFTLFQQHYSHTILIAMRTIRGGTFLATVTVGPLLALLVLTSYLLHRAHPVQGGEGFHTFASAFRDTVNAALGVGRGVVVPNTTMEWVVWVTLVAVGVVVTLLFWRVCLSPQESRTMSTQRLPLHPL
ncbi:hypothetical protein E2C01_019889 [Portunus trituberculatus]|uniref:Uncharacterized protein n=1 Tax=Portunus trituberculatus TaxID=210409 RepID=A0A5B7DYG5_PORTR|nr:hypothetical protein [Portunus trituberculatus]